MQLVDTRISISGHFPRTFPIFNSLELFVPGPSGFLGLMTSLDVLGSFLIKLKRFKKIILIRFHHLHLQLKFKLLAGKFTRKICWNHPAMFCLYTSWAQANFPAHNLNFESKSLTNNHQLCLQGNLKHQFFSFDLL